MKNTLRTIAIVSLLTSALICQRASADSIWDANKPFPVATNDFSCWMASAANMMAADGWFTAQWTTAQQIYDGCLRQNSAWQTANGGFIGGYQSDAISYYNNQTQADLDEIILAYSWAFGPYARNTNFSSTVLTPRAMIDSLLATPTATSPPNEAPEGADDPVGIAFWGNIGTTNVWAHAITVWGDTGDTLKVTDSDDGITATNYLSWANGGNSQTQIIYGGTTVTVGYASFLEEVPEPSTLALAGLGLGGLALAAYRRRSK